MAGDTGKDGFGFAPAPRGDAASPTDFPENAWHKVFALLSAGEVVRAAMAFLSNRLAQASIGSAWDLHAVLKGPWPRGVGGLKPFLAAARASHLTERVFCKVIRSVGSAEVLKPTFLCLTSSTAPPRSVAVNAAATALAFSTGDLVGEGLLAIAIGRDIKLIGRDDMKSCGTLALTLPKGCREVGSMVFSSDSSSIAVVPRAESGSFAPEIQFYSTQEKSKPIVTKMRNAEISQIDFLNAVSGMAGDLVVACGKELIRISQTTGEVVRTWKGDDGGAAFATFKAVSPHEVITLSEKTLSIWDLRTAEGVARRANATQVVTALDAASFPSSSVTFLGDIYGGLHRMDWRGSEVPVCELLWSPPEERERSRSHMVMVEHGCVSLVAGSCLTVLAIDPCVVELGYANVRGCLTAVAAGSRVWGFGIHDASGKTPQSTVVIVDTNGTAHLKKETVEEGGNRVEKQKKPKAKKAETQGKKPSSGKAAHGRNSGR